MPTVSRRTRFPDDSEDPRADDQPGWTRIAAAPVDYDYSADKIPGGGDRWSTWDQSQPLERGPEPYPDWLVTELGAVDFELGVLKTGKEADVFLLRREVPDT